MVQLTMTVILIISMFLYGNSAESKDCVNLSPNSEYDCTNIGLSAGYKCCYIKYSLGNNNFQACSPIYNSKKEINEYKKMLKDADNLKILCDSNGLKIDIFFLSFFGFILYFC